MGLGEAIEACDAATGAYPAYYMVNCAHPSHFRHVLDGDWRARIGGIRANASKMSHAELDNATELDPGDPEELARDYLDLMARLPRLRVLGGCCGTDHRHIGAISRACGHAHA
jgi:S-methylmethionine-dependent homocysteine/selenocysteine methylase